MATSQDPFADLPGMKNYREVAKEYDRIQAAYTTINNDRQTVIEERKRLLLQIVLDSGILRNSKWILHQRLNYTPFRWVLEAPQIQDGLLEQLTQNFSVRYHSLEIEEGLFLTLGDPAIIYFHKPDLLVPFVTKYKLNVEIPCILQKELQDQYEQAQVDLARLYRVTNELPFQLEEAREENAKDQIQESPIVVNNQPVGAAE